MASVCLPQRFAKAFSYTEDLGVRVLQAYSCGHGQFNRGKPITGQGPEISFNVYKTAHSLEITIHDGALAKWLYTVPSLRHCIHSRGSEVFSGSISMDVLLPYYPELSAQFARDEELGHTFDALDLFVRHFLRERSIFETFGFEHLHECHILTELHFHDIIDQSRFGSIAEDLDRLDDMVSEFMEVGDLGDLSESITPEMINEPWYKMPDSFYTDVQILPRDAVFWEQSEYGVIDFHFGKEIDWPDHTVGANAPINQPGIVNVETLCRAIHDYQPAIFQQLLEESAQVNPMDLSSGPLYQAAYTGRMDAVRHLLDYGVDIEGGRVLEGAASGGHLDIVRHLVENGANVNGNCHKSSAIHDSPLARALDCGHADIANYLANGGADLVPVVSRVIGFNHGCEAEILASLIARMPNESGHIPISRSAMVKCLVALSTNAYFNRRASTHFLLKNCEEPVIIDQIIPQQLCQHGHMNSRCQYESATYGMTALFSMLVLYAYRGEHTEYVPDLSCNLLQKQLQWHFVLCDLKDQGCKHCDERWQAIKLGLKTAFDHPTQGWGDMMVDSFLAAYQQLQDAITYDGKFKPDCGLADTQFLTGGELAHQRRCMASRLLARLGRSHASLIAAGARKEASAGLIALADQLGTKASTWRSGTRAIRAISKGNMPSRLTDIISVLRVADAMRSAIPDSDRVCPERQFTDDFPRWASLLTEDERPVFFEIASDIWGVPVVSSDHLLSTTFDSAASLFVLQNLVKTLVTASGLFEDLSGSFWGTYRLETLRQQDPPAMNLSDEAMLILPPDSWQPLMPEVPSQFCTEPPEPPDLEAERLDILARVTFLVAGAIFGAILIYLCQFRDGFTGLWFLSLSSDVRRDSSSSPILDRNILILHAYLGPTSFLNAWSEWDESFLKSAKDWFSPVLSAETGRDVIIEKLPTSERPYDGDITSIESIRSDDVSMEDESPEYSPSLSSPPTTSPSTTTPSSLNTTTPSSAFTGVSEDGTIRCQYCKSEFKLGKNGRRGQSSNLGKHMRNHHPEAIPGHRRVLYKCQWDCGATDPNKSNIETHMREHCWKIKNKQPRKHGKWHAIGDVTVAPDANRLIGADATATGPSASAGDIYVL